MNIYDVVTLNDGRRVRVYDVVDATHEAVIENPDNLCFGYRVGYSSVIDREFVDFKTPIIFSRPEVLAVERWQW